MKPMEVVKRIFHFAACAALAYAASYYSYKYGKRFAKNPDIIYPFPDIFLSIRYLNPLVAASLLFLKLVPAEAWLFGWLAGALWGYHDFVMGK